LAALAKEGNRPLGGGCTEVGVATKFKVRPTLSSVPVCQTRYRPFQTDSHPSRGSHALGEGGYKEVVGDMGLGFFSRLFLVPKKNGK